MKRTFSVLALLTLVISLHAVSFPARAEEEMFTIRYSPEEGKVFKYKADSRSQIYFGSFSFETITGQEVEMSLLEVLESGNYRMGVTFTKSSTKMMRMGDLIEQEPRIKPEGRTIKVEVDPKGEVIEALGFIMGLKKGRQLDNYMDKWFFELPEEAVGKDSEWERPIDERSEEGEDDRFTYTGTGKYKVKKITEKNGVKAAEIEGKAEIDVTSDSAQGIFTGKADVKMKLIVAIEGGYVIERESTVETKGKMISLDANGKEIENEINRVESDTVKLQK